MRSLMVAGVLSLLVGCRSAPADLLALAVVEPPAVDLAPVETRIEAAAWCRSGGDVGPTVEDSLKSYSTCATLASALSEAGLFSGGARTSPRAGYPGCLACFAVTQVSEAPVLSYRCALEVSVWGEPAVGRYEVLARAEWTMPQRNALSADGAPSAWQQLCDLAARALATHFAADAKARDLLRAQLSDEPATELGPLLVAGESFAPRAQWRTRRLIAWKNASLATFVSEARTSDLRALVGQLETCMVDLAHGAELSKDSAQTSVAALGHDAGARALSLALLERLEVLRPILAAVKEELDARGR